MSEAKKMNNLAVKKTVPSASPQPHHNGKAQTQPKPTPSEHKESKSIINDKLKTNVNLAFNCVSALFNLLTFINGNFPLIDTIQEQMENVSAFFSKSATAVQGLLNGIIALEKKNLISSIGGFLELPIAYRISGYDLYLARGVSAGLNQFDSIISRTKKTTNSKIVTDDKGNPQYYDNFKKEGFLEGCKIIFKNIPTILKEFYEKPLERSGLFARSFLLCSTFMILGPLISLVGLYKFGATVRHTFGGLAGLALATDLKTNTNIKQTAEGKKAKGLSNYAISGIIWAIAALPDVLKHFDFFSSKVNNGTELALCLDRTAGLFYTFGNLRLGEK